MANETKSRKGIGGPKTKEGKERIRLNALKMGLHANSIVGMQAVADVLGVTFDEVHRKMLDYYQPADPIEEALVRRIARCTWKLQYIEAIEDYRLESMQLQHAPGGSLEVLSVIERRTDVQLHRAIAALTSKRRNDQENVKNKLTAHLRPEEPAAQPVPDTVDRDLHAADHACGATERCGAIPARAGAQCAADSRCGHVVYYGRTAALHPPALSPRIAGPYRFPSACQSPIIVALDT